MADNNTSSFVSKFDDLYQNNRSFIFNAFQEGGFTLSEQKEIFDGLNVKQKCKLYNTISVDSRNIFFNSLDADDAKEFSKVIRK